MTTHNLVGRRAQEHLHLLGSEGLLCPCLCNPNIVLDIGLSRISFILQLIPGTLPLIPKRNNLFNRGSQGGCSRRLSARSSWGSWSDGGPLIHHLHSSSPNVGKGLVLLGLHSCVHSLIKLHCHPCKRKILVKKKLKRRRRRRRKEQHR